MPLIKISLTATLLFITVFASAQRMEINGWRFNIVPSSLFDYRGMNLPFGAELCFGDRFGWLMETAIPFNSLPYTTKGKDINADHRIRTEIRNYFGRGKTSRGIMGLEIGFRHQEFRYTREQTFVQHGYAHSFTSADVRKNLFTVAFTLGINCVVAKNVLVDLYVGIGRKEVNNLFTNVVNDRNLGDYEGWFIGEDHQFSYAAGFFFPAGIRVGYLRPKKKAMQVE